MSTQLLRANPFERGYSVAFHPGERNICPGCGKSHWSIGRLMAECAICATALPLSTGGSFGAGHFALTNPQKPLAA